MFKLPFTKQSRNRRRSSTPSFLQNKREARRFGKYLDSLDWVCLRIKFVGIIFVIFWIGLWFKAWNLQIIDGPYLAEQASQQYLKSRLIAGPRGMLLDRNGQILARSVEVKSVYANPHLIGDHKHVSSVLAPILKIEYTDLYDQLSTSKRKFIWLSRKVDDQTASAVAQAKLKGIGLSKEFDRVYPFKQLAGQLLGFVGIDDKGLEGVERTLDEQLVGVNRRHIYKRDARGRAFYLNSEAEQETKGNNVTLTLDVQIQFIAEKEISRAVEKYGATWGGVLVADVANGHILAWAQYPYFNPNSYRDYSPGQYRNRLAIDAIEPGSTLKPLLIAAVLQEKLVTPTTVFDCELGKWTTKSITIRDTSNRGMLSVSDIVRYSSNIGMAKIGLLFGAENYYGYLRKLGFGERSKLPVAQALGIIRNHKRWKEVDLMTASFGQSFSVTAVQTLQAYLTLLNKGVYMPLRLVKNKSVENEKPERIFSEQVSLQVMQMMRDVVHANGSGRRAKIAGIEVGGKTGTAQKADYKTGRYGDGRMASFIGYLPATNPRYLIVVIVDEPTKNQYGGVVAAPVFKNVASYTMTYKGDVPLLADTKHKIRAKTMADGFAYTRSLKISDLKTKLKQDSAANKFNRELKKYVSVQEHKGITIVPNVVGKSVRSAVEQFAKGGIVPEIKGSGQHVVRQYPLAGQAWPEADIANEYILWLSKR